MDTRNGISRADPSNFRNLVAGKTDKLLTGVWGGYMDAGDWDRRIQHLISSVYLLDLAEQFPSCFQSLSLGIPESPNPLPDVVDEALFNLDFYRRTPNTPGRNSRGHRIRGASQSRRDKLAGIVDNSCLRAGKLVQFLLCGGCRQGGVGAEFAGTW